MESAMCYVVKELGPPADNTPTVVNHFLSSPTSSNLVRTSQRHSSASTCFSNHGNCHHRQALL